MSDHDRQHVPRRKVAPMPAADVLGVLERRASVPASRRYARPKRLPPVPVPEPEIAPVDLRVGG